MVQILSLIFQFANTMFVGRAVRGLSTEITWHNLPAADSTETLADLAHYDAWTESTTPRAFGST